MKTNVKPVNEHLALDPKLPQAASIRRKKDPSKNYRADFLWPFKQGSIEEAAYEFANGTTEDYVKLWFDILVTRLGKLFMNEMHKMAKAGVRKQKLQKEKGRH